MAVHRKEGHTDGSLPLGRPAFPGLSRELGLVLWDHLLSNVSRLLGTLIVDSGHNTFLQPQREGTRDKGSGPRAHAPWPCSLDPGRRLVCLQAPMLGVLPRAESETRCESVPQAARQGWPALTLHLQAPRTQTSRANRTAPLAPRPLRAVSGECRGQSDPETGAALPITKAIKRGAPRAHGPGHSHARGVDIRWDACAITFAPRSRGVSLSDGESAVRSGSSQFRADLLLGQSGTRVQEKLSPPMALQLRETARSPPSCSRRLSQALGGVGGGPSPAASV